MQERTIQVTLVRSRYHRQKDQRQTLKGLGLSRMHKTVTLKDTPPIRGMIRKVAHLVEVVGDAR